MNELKVDSLPIDGADISAEEEWCRNGYLPIVPRRSHPRALGSMTREAEAEYKSMTGRTLWQRDVMLRQQHEEETPSNPDIKKKIINVQFTQKGVIREVTCSFHHYTPYLAITAIDNDTVNSYEVVGHNYRSESLGMFFYSNSSYSSAVPSPLSASKPGTTSA